MVYIVDCERRRRKEDENAFTGFQLKYQNAQSSTPAAGFPYSFHIHLYFHFTCTSLP